MYAHAIKEDNHTGTEEEDDHAGSDCVYDKEQDTYIPAGNQNTYACLNSTSKFCLYQT